MRKIVKSDKNRKISLGNRQKRQKSANSSVNRQSHIILEIRKECPRNGPQCPENGSMCLLSSTKNKKIEKIFCKWTKKFGKEGFFTRFSRGIKKSRKIEKIEKKVLIIHGSSDPIPSLICKHYLIWSFLDFLEFLVW